LFLPLVWLHGIIGHLGEPAPKVPHQKFSTSTRLPTVLHSTYSISCLHPLPTSIHFLSPSTSCLHPLPASVHFLPSSTSCLRPLPAFIHFLPPSTSCLHPLPAFIHFLPSSTSCLHPLASTSLFSTTGTAYSIAAGRLYGTSNGKAKGLRVALHASSSAQSQPSMDPPDGERSKDSVINSINTLHTRSPRTLYRRSTLRCLWKRQVHSKLD
jgi:hypothetical protein